MPRVNMLIGLPGSGKSTFAKKLDGVYVCPDEVRRELYGDISVQGNPVEVFSVVEERIKKALSKGKDVVYDATNTTEYRKDTIAEFRQWGATEVDGYYTVTAFTVCMERNRNRTDRSEPVPVDVMERMKSNLKANPPRKEEGFDHLYAILDGVFGLIEVVN